MAGQDVKSDALFAIGMAIMLLTPLLLAVCIAWCRFRSCHYTSTLTRAGASAHQQSKLLPELPKAATKTWRRVKCSRAGSPASSIATDSEDEEQALQPKRPGRRVARRAEERPSSVAKTLTSKMRRHGSAAMPFEWNHLTTIHFRRSDWAVQRRKPLSTKAGLHNISTLPELHRALHRSLHRATGDELVAPLSSLTSSLPLTVEHRDKRGKLQLLGEGDIAKLSDLDTLYVTISISSPAAGDDKDSDCDDNGSEVLVDLSLSGCCGIRSTYGGLVVTGCAGSSSSPQREKRNEQGGARPGHNCLG
mmetsp:Transcript_1346/g.3804  ORF Transcript_1346/g.3804 Transcript_1346/m.3804 type:complete len:305 (+) Transcript_1346:180-1094(+)|eukprot:CAMPEP_0115890896 /NCGR_PEP_ID=MMETSP0287-20121206/33585_1 /TAXON_ID=412157 /ORGANISM="Chrysochromulina rotalis, Strain UIO044" /LENGTH=304 /DNA_ID=CAMNT_0003347677 /DNA_START=119 /DNA_END=1033 /DNA_ORIENTATION=+